VPKSVVAVRHIQFEHLGAFEPVLRRRGYTVRYCDIGLYDVRSIDPVAHDLVIVLGGPIGAYEDDAYPFLRHELALLERRLAAARPTLGICLGAQLMARALGARVFPAPTKEIGWGELQLSEAGRAVTPSGWCAGAAVAWRHLRPARRRRASRFDRDLREPGVQPRASRAGLPIPPRDQGARFRTLADRTRRRNRRRTGHLTRRVAARHPALRTAFGAQWGSLPVRMAFRIV
jgi:putative intracellular protease/amidase